MRAPTLSTSTVNAIAKNTYKINLCYALNEQMSYCHYVTQRDYVFAMLMCNVFLESKLY